MNANLHGERAHGSQVAARPTRRLPRAARARTRSHRGHAEQRGDPRLARGSATGPRGTPGTSAREGITPATRRTPPRSMRPKARKRQARIAKIGGLVHGAAARAHLQAKKGVALERRASPKRVAGARSAARGDRQSQATPAPRGRTTQTRRCAQRGADGKMPRRKDFGHRTSPETGRPGRTKGKDTTAQEGSACARATRRRADAGREEGGLGRARGRAALDRAAQPSRTRSGHSPRTLAPDRPSIHSSDETELRIFRGARVGAAPPEGTMI